MVNGYQLVQTTSIKDDRGSLSFIEIGKIIKFPINRIYWLYDFNQDRGAHAHKRLKQFIFCVTGSVDFILDDGNNRDIITLDSADKGILIEKPLWRDITNFQNNPSVIVLASEKYDETDYIRSYTEFKQWTYNS